MVTGRDTPERRAQQAKLRHDFEFVSLGWGPGPTQGPNGGWAIGRSNYFRCIKCDYLLSDEFADYDVCFCGAMATDVDAGRFWSDFGDEKIEVLHGVPKVPPAP